MTDEHIDRLVRAADPYDSQSIRDLRGADQTLLEEIMAAASETQDNLGRRRAWRRPLVGALVAAAVLAIAISVPALRDDPRPSPSGKGQTVQAGDSTDQIVYSAAAVEVAKRNPRLLIDEPGWKVTTVVDFAKDNGTIVFNKGKREIEMNWYPADQYQSYYDDRTEVSKRESITIDGRSGSRVSYSATDIAAMLEPEGSSFVEIRAGRFDDTADILSTFAKLKHVDVDTWLAALPPEIVTVGETLKAVDEILADIPLPPGFDNSGLEQQGVNSRYYIGAAVVDRVECGWLREWKRASDLNDGKAERAAVKALKSARGWKILDEMDLPDAEYVEGPWGLADEIAVGQDPMIYIERFNCLEPK